jgi:hypothetical protein
MGDQAKGNQAGFTIFEQDARGADPGTPDGEKLYLKQFNIGKSQERLEDETIAAGRGVLEPIPGNIDVGGPLNGNLGGQSFGKLLKNLLGIVNTSGAGPYQHVITIGDLTTWLLFELDNGATLAGTSRYMKYRDCKIASATFTFKDSGFIDCSFTIMGADGIKSATPLDASITDLGHKSFSAFSGILKEGGSVFASATEITLTIDNDLSGDGYVFGGQGVRQDIAEGQCKVSGSVTGLLNSDGQAIVDKGIDDTETSLEISVQDGVGDGTSGNEKCTFLVQQMKYGVAVPGVDGPAGRVFSVDFSAYLSGADSGLEITLENAVATI